MTAIDYTEERGICDEGTLCGLVIEGEPQAFDFVPTPLCWRCREATKT